MKHSSPKADIVRLIQTNIYKYFVKNTAIMHYLHNIIIIYENVIFEKSKTETHLCKITHIRQL